ncbi:hypothetical protein G6F37_005816 [Rhizopus arrhizus]|nr:hypothetical protein G6F38_005911 [Rhizopus arrhizus]KAG1158412.1 hypothetical protein G6F37_005816 [Rhizopus arrhizus]
MGITIQQNKLKYVYITSIVGCLLLWFTIYEYPADQKADLVTDIEEDRLCTPTTYNIGQWIYDPSPFTNIAQKSGYNCIKKKFAHRCFRRLSEPDEIVRSKQILDYRWQPSQCHLLEMNTDLLADHFLQRPILFIGDSITQLQFESLSCLLGHRYQKRQATMNGGNPRLRVSEIGNENSTALAYIRSDYLLRLDDFKIMEPFDSNGVQLGSGENYPWVHAISEFKYIVINTGPHWHVNERWGPNRSEQELLSAYEKAMTIVYQYLKDHLQSDQTVWVRTTPHGHAKCSQYTSPQPSPVAPSGKLGEYDWHLFKEFDLIWKKLIAKGNDNRFQQFDIAAMSNMRGDAHSRPDKDCLHTCLPGPVDDWNRLLYHEIMKK